MPEPTDEGSSELRAECHSTGRLALINGEGYSDPPLPPRVLARHRRAIPCKRYTPAVSRLDSRLRENGGSDVAKRDEFRSFARLRVDVDCLGRPGPGGSQKR